MKVIYVNTYPPKSVGKKKWGGPCKFLALHLAGSGHPINTGCSHGHHHHHRHQGSSFLRPHCQVPIHMSGGFPSSPAHPSPTSTVNPRQSLCCLPNLVQIIQIYHAPWYPGIRYPMPLTDLNARAQGWVGEEDDLITPSRCSFSPLNPPLF